MNKTTILAMIFILLALVSCAKQETTQAETMPQPVREVPVQEPEVVEEEKAFIPEDAYEIKGVESSDVITVSYKTRQTTDNTAELESVEFVIRNYGKENIKPRVLLQVFGDSMGIKEFYEYDQLPPGYKFIKTESLNAEIDAPKLKKDINAQVLDMNKGMQLLGQDSKQFIAIKPK